MKIETFQIILESALDGITQYRPHENTKEVSETRKEADRLLDIVEKQEAGRRNPCRLPI